MLSPKRTKFRKQHRGRMRGVASKGNTIAFGQFALQAQDLSLIHISEPTRRYSISYAVFCLLQSDVQLPSHSLELGEQIDRMQ